MNCLRVNPAIVLLALLLSACSLNPIKTTEPLGHWSFSGKMAVRNATEASSFNVVWQQADDQYTIELSGPLGQGAVTVIGEPGSVELQRGDDRWSSYSLNALVYEVTEMDLPLEHLKYWVRALPDPTAPHELQRNSTNLVSTIDQSGWHVEISDYFITEQGNQPRKLAFSRAGNSGKLVIRQWTIASNDR
ncbi:lipoprotein insertase outer membrane protein LolB [Reinekea blandensis]|uniref:Outer-membrane lipoprotein LolB n=1 Tax=Reinekea blandensis MED297 TaxID=314283 RepID=A4BI73_9GAMM|nr:lipoprotein insertase outer membrane protein LolB [Reinekea blandensis]EAR08216.1 outer membrane lipoprotein LolB precursor [Reinekea sp. MED297] [Reinekea blandensis MED297]